MHRETFTTGYCKLALIVAAIVCASPAAAQGQAFAGQWTGGWFPPVKDAAYGRDCLFAHTTQVKLDLVQTPGGSIEGSMLQYGQVQVLGVNDTSAGGPPDVRARCGLVGSDDPLLGAQIKAWLLRAKAPAGGSLDATTTSAECRNSWCSSADSRFDIKPGATNFDTRFYLADGVLYDNNGTAKPDDDIAFLPRARYDARAKEGASVAMKFAKAVASQKAADWKPLLIDSSVEAGVAGFVQQRSDSLSHITGVNEIFVFLATRGDPVSDRWDIRLRLRFDDGTTRDMNVGVAADPSGAPRVFFFWVH